MKKLLFLTALTSIVFVSNVHAFDRKVNFCNRTTTDVYVAIAADFEGTSGFTSKGWYKTSACTCRTVINTGLRATEVFLYAKWAGKPGNILSNAKGPACLVPGGKFVFEVQNRNQRTCQDAQGSWEMFKYFNTDVNENSSYNLRRGNDCNLMDDTE